MYRREDKIKETFEKIKCKDINWIELALNKLL